MKSEISKAARQITELGMAELVIQLDWKGRVYKDWRCDSTLPCCPLCGGAEGSLSSSDKEAFEKGNPGKSIGHSSNCYLGDVIQELKDIRAANEKCSKEKVAKCLSAVTPLIKDLSKEEAAELFEQLKAAGGK